jgi:hypothetical protein
MAAAAGRAGKSQRRRAGAARTAGAAARGGDAAAALAGLGDHAVEARVAAVAAGNHRGSGRRRAGADGEVAALVGVALQPMAGGIAMPWLLTGRPVDRHAKAFLRLTRARTQAMRAEHGKLVAFVHADYRQAVRWLAWLGFELAPARPVGPHGALFHQATMRDMP